MSSLRDSFYEIFAQAFMKNLRRSFYEKAGYLFGVSVYQTCCESFMGSPGKP